MYVSVLPIITQELASNFLLVGAFVVAKKGVSFCIRIEGKSHARQDDEHMEMKTRYRYLASP